MFRKSSDVDFLKTGKVVIDADGVDVDLSLPLRRDTTVGTRIFAGDTMIYGDTGWRDIQSLLPAGIDVSGSGSGFALMRRVGNVVEIRVQSNSTIAGTSPKIAIPPGFRFLTKYYRIIAWAAYTNTDAPQPVRANSVPHVIYLPPIPASAPNIAFSAIWTTTDAWPTTLLGLPA